MDFKVNLSRPDVGQAEIDAVSEVLRGPNLSLGPKLGEFEGAFADYIGRKRAVAVNSGTSGLFLCATALDIGEGDEVITTPFTFIASATSMMMAGAKPVFVDIDPESLNIDTSRIEEKITDKTRAILPVEIFGSPAGMEEVCAIAAKRKLVVIEDSCEALGSQLNGKKTGSFGTMSLFAFYPNKQMTTGEGGIILTDNDELAEKMRAIRTHGSLKKHYHPILGLNGRFDTIQAAVLLAKFPHYDKEVKAREKIGARYSELIRDCCVVPKIQKGNTHVYAQYTIRVPDRDLLAQQLKSQGIPTAIYYQKCLHQQPVFAYLGYKKVNFPEAEKASEEVISLPMHPWLSGEEQDTVVQAVRKTVLANV